MTGKVYATLTSKGQITVPRELRAAWKLAPGDRIGFVLVGPAEARIEPSRRRSIFDGLDGLVVAVDRSIDARAIDEAAEDAMAEQESRVRQRRAR